MSHRLMTRTERRAAQRHMDKENAAHPKFAVEVPPEMWSANPPPGLIKVFRSCDYFVQVFNEPPPAICRLSICRTGITASGWKADIPWEDIQRLKSECGYGDCDAVEIYPHDMDVVNVANMRHCWILAEPLSFAWRR